ncbi:LOW QUALITY PROTEIN: membrane-bound transcription factor site-2 protease-like [Manduca sexta]|uniref:LOW QUALITY PROTEIN: membrane-bound transcription factor site-2 protease-like n=1 Tax=Manduca sexta TaxID=7130 RepID=UPI0018901EA2|nr:LOW QUALITY PROTEIN: membrane-bound transcription factor site-2 protease-like [Manduca sexta]
MSFAILCTFVLTFYVVIWFFDSVFKSCMHYPYYAFLEGTGLKVGILNFSWTTTAFNRFIYRWSKTKSCPLRKWFTCGYLFTIWVFLPFAIWTLLTFIFEHFYETIQLNHVPEVKAMLPGINIPASDFWVYFLAIGFSTVFHELGHAMAAAQEDVQLLSVGVYVFTIIPVAFVQINTEHLNSLAVTKRLKIYCAGVWHNIATALVALLLFFSAPILFNIAYETGVGVRVVDFTADSPLKSARGLEKDDIITSVNGCDIKSSNDWMYCLHMAHERFGLCTSAEFVAQNDEIMMETVKENDVVECCRKDDLTSFCFEYMEPKVVAESVLPGQYSCLKPRDMVKEHTIKCTEAGGYSCPRAMHCLKPSLNNHTYFLIIERKDNNAVLYLGVPYDLHKTVFIDQYFPRLKLFSFFSPSQFEKLLRYIFIFSMGIGFLNVVPCYGMDGHHITRNLIQILAKYLNKNGDFITFFTVFTIVVGTGVTGPILVYLFYKAIYFDN